MNYLDLFLLLTLVSGAFWGFKKGLIRAVLGFLALGLAIWAGLKFSYLIEPYFQKTPSIPIELLPILSIVVTILLVVVAVNIVGKIIHSLVKTIGLGFLNRLGGAMFGFLINVFVLSSLFYYLIPIFSGVFPTEMVADSKIIPYLTQLAEILKRSFL